MAKWLEHWTLAIKIWGSNPPGGDISQHDAGKFSNLIFIQYIMISRKKYLKGLLCATSPWSMDLCLSESWILLRLEEELDLASTD